MGKEALDELKNSELLLSKIEVLEKTLSERDEEIKVLQNNEASNISQLKSTLSIKAVELENLKSDMKIAIQSMENLRIQEKAKKEDQAVSENIEDELSMLQNAILEAERQMKLFREENMLLRQNETISEKLSEKLELEN